MKVWVLPSNIYKQVHQVEAELCAPNGVRWMGGDGTFSYAYGDDWSLEQSIVLQRLKVMREKQIAYLRMQIRDREAKIAKLEGLL